MMMSMPMSMRGSLVQRTTPNPSACSPTRCVSSRRTNPTNEALSPLSRNDDQDEEEEGTRASTCNELKFCLK